MTANQMMNAFRNLPQQIDAELAKRRAFKAWHRALNASRKSVVKKMQALGCTADVYTKRDKGRTIMMVFVKTPSMLTVLKNEIDSVNRKWATKLVSERGTQWFVGLSDLSLRDYRGDGYTLLTLF